MRFPAFAVLASLFPAGCAVTPPDVLSTPGPVDPATEIKDTHYHPVIVDYTHRQPVEPGDWRQLNDRLSPANRGDDS